MMVTSIHISRTGGIATERATRADDEYLRYRLDVFAAGAADVVQSAGGWLFDRARAGWSVSVLIARGCDTRPLRILGLQALDLNTKSALELVSTASRMPGHSLAVSAEVLTGDVRIRDTVFEALDHQPTEVALWGEGWPSGVNRTMATVQHVLSPAARVFKGYALAAAGSPCDSVDPIETLLCDGDERWRT
ncbi:hypothetical protein A5745_11175 [Mycobacterium sp. IS-2888]|uniref:hypothetical protein n=2 Tax=unclassified Mycobacterium TaxID=2642494 RepID=UPI00096C7737|nr:hypothetical protein A5744_14735 [Mycobacterium sp. IS-1264]OMC46943.1 hypothetical protein A5745_11175 [Mycobacterium sp. IS-2888]